MATEHDTTDATPEPSMPRLTQYETEYVPAEQLLDNRLYQASALSALLYGEGAELLRTRADDIQDGVLWALHSLIEDARIAAGRLNLGRGKVAP